MDETLVWIPIALAELLLLVSIALGVFLHRARKVERLLRQQLEDREQAGQAVALAPMEPVTAVSQMDLSMEHSQSRLHDTSECLVRLMAELQEEKTLAEQCQLDLAGLKQNLADMAHEVEGLRHANARLQQELRSKQGVLDGTALTDRGSKEKILLYIKRLRDDLATLQLKLASSEADVFRLRQEKEALAADHSALLQEYERLYANFRA